ncbi:MAG TPA: aminodeoxychorismate/anthranilate synthase component II [Bacteroidales bacterium]|nr:aminodeoxychorismate/anthranilate synthase component II [Bacteroidales bacterium]
MNILILDNYDSFTYNLFHIIESILHPGIGLEVWRNDQIEVEALSRFDKIVISPGPGLPQEAGIICEAISRWAPEKSILGVCLGHQAITRAFGGSLKNLNKVLHGVSIPVTITNQEATLFRGLPQTIETGRYHSWVPDRDSFPDSLLITAVDAEGNILALQHRTYCVHGVQFHPESIMTPHGKQILRNWVGC